MSLVISSHRSIQFCCCSYHVIVVDRLEQTYLTMRMQMRRNFAIDDVNRECFCWMDHVYVAVADLLAVENSAENNLLNRHGCFPRAACS